jgi:hypothetical protein
MKVREGRGLMKDVEENHLSIHTITDLAAVPEHFFHDEFIFEVFDGTGLTSVSLRSCSSLLKNCCQMRSRSALLNPFKS